MPGAGVRVAVVDSGVAAGASVPVVERVSFSTGTELGEYHGTAVAGLVAGRLRAGAEPLPVGFAPGAEIVDVRVYDRTQPDEGEVGVETSRVAAGLRWVAANAERLRIGVANVSLQVSPTAELAAAVREVVARDVVVVAGSGNRPVEGDPLFAEFGEVEDGEDAAEAVFPAGYDDVVAVNATAAGIPVTEGEVDVRGSVLQSSATDVAAPDVRRGHDQRQRRHLRAADGGDLLGRRRGQRRPGPDPVGVPRTTTPSRSSPACGTPRTARPPTRPC